MGEQAEILKCLKIEYVCKAKARRKRRTNGPEKGTDDSVQQQNGGILEDCDFPFRYEDVLYDQCTQANYEKPWCATLTDEDDNYVEGQWKNCTLSSASASTLSSAVSKSNGQSSVDGNTKPSIEPTTAAFLSLTSLTSTDTAEVPCTPPQGLLDSGYWKSYGKYYKVRDNCDLEEVQLLNKYVLQQKDFTSPEYYQDAADRCANDGANLAMAKSADDESYLKDLGDNYWIGLRKKDSQQSCSNADCNNKLAWADGSDYVHNGVLYVTATGNSGTCFFVRDQGAFVMSQYSCTSEKKMFFCQYECPATTTTTSSQTAPVSTISISPIAEGIITHLTSS